MPTCQPEGPSRAGAFESLREKMGSDAGLAAWLLAPHFLAEKPIRESAGLTMRPRVVLVDDDTESCHALGELLAHEGFAIHVFQNGEAVCIALESGALRPDVIVSDVRMPVLDGIAMLRRIKARFASMPVVLVSAFADEPMWVQGLEAGAADVFPKPIHGASLIRALRKLARKA